MVTRSIAFGPSAGTADAKTTIGSAYTFATQGRIKQIRCVWDNATADIGVHGQLSLDFKRIVGPFDFAVGGLTSKQTAGEGMVPTIVIDVDIPYSNGEVVTVSLKATETATDVEISLTLEEPDPAV